MNVVSNCAICTCVYTDSLKQGSLNRKVADPIPSHPYSHTRHHRKGGNLVQAFLFLQTQRQPCVFCKPSGYLLSAVAVVADQVGRAAQVARDLARGGSRFEPAGNTRDTRDTLDGDTVQNKSSNVRSGHGGTADAVGGAIAGVPRRQNVGARTKDVEDSAVVGVRSNGPGAVNSADSNSARGRSRRGVGGVGTVVSSSNGRDDTGAGGRLNSVVERRRVATTERHVDNGLCGSALADNIIGSPVETGEDNGGAGRRALEHLDSLNGGLLSNTVSLSANSTGNMGSVANGIGVLATEGSVDGLSTALELAVSSPDTCVNDVGISACTSIGVVDVAGGSPGTVRDRSKSPSSARLGCQGTLRERFLLGLLLSKVDGPDAILFDKGDLIQFQYFWRYEDKGLLTSGFSLISLMVFLSKDPA